MIASKMPLIVSNMLSDRRPCCPIDSKHRLDEDQHQHSRDNQPEIDANVGCWGPHEHASLPGRPDQTAERPELQPIITNLTCWAPAARPHDLAVVGSTVSADDQPARAV